ncbi:MarR family winged helix-turn-helix transcriptional regulator [Stackebrandtia nassauensis]|uniref:Transcriptional regulator, MarR family n=1 Tax=Stackebrandtia nassauensis (strain DSM 44728 / CIP 108903 / NRRL B-16338 / NBRC 102104 / LLR-40K-21) TaxID=446470 RepID=D3Q302_STANL|nr:MarR family transcriptional regulator [Stackebrandtia nassauensis]ADD39972.1 transcriptional regulator, MarR family [Stackebrandtia nassauensis DSM 44728]
MPDMMDEVQRLWHEVRPEADVGPMGVVGRIQRASRLLEQGHRDYFSRFDIDDGEFNVLATIRRYGPPYTVTPGKLTETSYIKAAAITNRVDRLVAKGYVTRETDPDNRRKVRVTLTSSGLDIVERAFDGHVTNEDRMLAALDGEEREQLAGLLRKLLESLGDVPKG